MPKKRQLISLFFPLLKKKIPLFFQLTPHGLAQVAEFDTRDGVYDVAWSEAADGVVATAGGDGSVKLWAVNAPPRANPAASFQEHAREVAGADPDRGLRQRPPLARPHRVRGSECAARFARRRDGRGRRGC